VDRSGGNQWDNDRLETNEMNPATASPLNKTWLRWSGKDKWLMAYATVFSCDWRGLSNQVDSPVGFYDVVYSYSVNGNQYTGNFSDYGMEDEEYLKRDDTFEIRYNPANPAKSYYPDLRTRTSFLLVSATIGAAAGIIVLIAKFLLMDRGH
jgi:hypothetical protein